MIHSRKSGAVIGAVLVVTAWASGPGLAKPSPACPEARFVLDSPLIPDEPGSTAIVTDAAGKPSLAPCGQAKGAFTRKKNLKVKAAWSKCTGASGSRPIQRLLLKGSVTDDCSQLRIEQATIKLAKQKKPIRRSNLVARRSLGCGDGILDGGRGEECDGGGCPAGEVCGETCSCTAVVTTTTTIPSGSTTTTTVSTTTTTTLGSRCVGGAPNGTLDAGEECDDGDPSAPLGCNACVLCGNGIVTAPQEQCDDSNLICGDGCAENCAIERCGDRVVTCDESCDDGDDDNFDGCPNSCKIGFCEGDDSNTFLATVSFRGETDVAAILVGLDYPEDRVAIRGRGRVDRELSDFPSNTQAAANDLDYALKVSVLHNFAVIPNGQLFRVRIQRCVGAPPVTAGDFACVVLSSADGEGKDNKATTTCSVTLS